MSRNTTTISLSNETMMYLKDLRDKYFVSVSKYIDNLVKKDMAKELKNVKQKILQNVEHSCQNPCIIEKMEVNADGWWQYR